MLKLLTVRKNCKTLKKWVRPQATVQGPEQEWPILGLTPINPAPCSVGEYESGPEYYQPERPKNRSQRLIWMTEAVLELEYLW